ncbi:MAG: aminopeptidase P family protein [Actinobacteria bacterium]|nr:aminopeptidase P family protein [Actinomycetota bacterium]
MSFSATDLGILRQLIDEPVEPQRAFAAGEYAARLDKLRAAMAAAHVDLVLLSSPEAQCWLHGYQARWYRAGSTTEWPPVNFTAVHVDHDRIIVFDSADHARLVHFTSIATDVRHPGDPDPGMATVHGFVIGEVAAEGWLTGTVGIEEWSPRQSAATTSHLASLLEGRVRIADVSVMLRDLQRIKSAAEIEVMREAARILDVGYTHLQSVLHPEMTEIEVWAELELAMTWEGGETGGLHDTISRTRHYCHAFSSSRHIGHGQLLADPCGVKHRYHANTARQFYLGEPPPALLAASAVAAGAADVLVDVARPGVSFATVSARLREYYKESGLWELRDWIGGYQLGIAFPPDWVGEFVWDVELDEHEKQIEHGLVTNFESFVGAGDIDTVVFLDSGAELLGETFRGLLIVDV